MISKALNIAELNASALEFCGIPCYSLRDDRVQAVTGVSLTKCTD